MANFHQNPTVRRDAEYLAISDASFDVIPGELVALVGPSGWGKTTLLKILAGLHGHDGGEIRIGSSTHAFDPARMADNITIKLPHPRTLDMKTDKVFGDYTRHIYKLLGIK